MTYGSLEERCLLVRKHGDAGNPESKGLKFRFYRTVSTRFGTFEVFPNLFGDIPELLSAARLQRRDYVFFVHTSKIMAATKTWPDTQRANV
jgi:hypothetical protein